ncbi:hypothetical protein BFJ72_g10314 [Fusarium proliferatum]|uniref:Major facilitator superfamily (MFS) profile domain-containing protein n=1 Tax=Gibberella intermedia TaxID=948311 RepID=A0A420SU41_GIBIN|nr:hypothetical protein BFJ72_g10314 [Fusarium proliferatum]
MFRSPIPSVSIPSTDLLSYVFEGSDPVDPGLPILISPENHDHENISKPQAKDLVQRLARGLQVAGFQPGNTTCLFSSNNIYQPIISLGSVAAGGVWTGMNPGLSDGEVKRHLTNSDTKFLFCCPTLRVKALRGASECGIPKANVFTITPLTTKDPTQNPWTSLLAHGSSPWTSFNDEATAKSTTACLYPTSGTSGLPKLAMLSHHNVISAAVLLNEVERRDYQVRQVMLWPMFHAASLIWSHITPLRQGWQTYIPSRFDPSKFLDIVGQFQCTDTGMAPAMMLAVLHIDRPDHEKRRKLSSMRYGICGSAPVGPELERRWREIIPSNCPWSTAYGMTELTGVVSKVHYPVHDNTSSVGALIPNTEAMLFDDEGIEITAYNQPGELFIRGPTVFKGYYKNRVATHECLESGFIRTGDVVYIESESKKLAMSKSEVQITDTQHVEQVDRMVAEERALVERRLVRKIDMRLMPMLWLLMVFSYLDRSNLGAANVAGMNKTLNLSDQDYYHAIVTFQVAYVISGTPSNMIIVRLRPSLYIPAIMFLWGTCATFLGAVQSREQLWAVRFLLGVTEAGFAPGVMFMFSCWYKREEQAKRFIIFLSASILSGAFGGVLAGAISGHLDGARGIEGWRWLFITEGVLTVAMALFAPFSLLDYPATSKGLTAEERLVAVERLTTEDITAATGSHENSLSHGRAFVSAVTNWRLYFLALPYMQLVGSSALAYFYPYLIQGLGYTSVKAQYMTTPLYIVALTIAIPTSVAADMFPLQRGFFVFTIMLLGAIFCALATGIRAYVPRYVFLCFINSAIWTGSPIALSYAASNLGPVDSETRAISLGIINGLSQLAQIYGSALFPRSEAPEYLTGFTTYTLLFATGSVIALSGSFLLRKYPYKADF